MPMDGVMLGFVARQLDTMLRDGRVDGVLIQPEGDEVIPRFARRGSTHRRAQRGGWRGARAPVDLRWLGPMEPPMFCMLLREIPLRRPCVLAVRHVRAFAKDRILRESDISNLSELGDPVTRTMVVEIMGRHSNIILRAADGRIVDAVRHVEAG